MSLCSPQRESGYFGVPPPGQSTGQDSPATHFGPYSVFHESHGIHQPAAAAWAACDLVVDPAVPEDLFDDGEERAAIAQYEGKISRAEAEAQVLAEMKEAENGQRPWPLRLHLRLASQLPGSPLANRDAPIFSVGQILAKRASGSLPRQML